MKKLPNKFNTTKVQDGGFKKQTVEMFNSLIDCIKELQEEIKQLKTK